MNKKGGLESQLMDAFKEKEEKELDVEVQGTQRLIDKEEAARIAKVQKRWDTKFSTKWRQKNKRKKKMAKASRRANR